MIENVINNPRIPKAGTIWAWGSSSIPYGWLLCDGSAVSRTNYKALFDSIGTTYGAGDGTTTFNLPNGRIAVANSLQCKGNGMTIGLSDGTHNIGLALNNSSASPFVVAGPTNYGTNSGSLTGAYSQPTLGYTYGLSTDPTKSGIIYDQSNQTLAIIKY